MNVSGARPYTSPLRAEQAAATRRRVLDAAIDLLQEAGSGEVAIPEVAERAGVSASTAYRAFPSREDLLDAVLDELKARFAGLAGPRPASLDDFVESADRAVHAVYEVEPLYRALFATPAGQELHRSTALERSGAIEAMLREELDGLGAEMTDEQIRRFVAVVHLVSSSRSILFLKDYQGLGVEDSVGAIRWALRALVAAGRDQDTRAEL